MLAPSEINANKWLSKGKFSFKISFPSLLGNVPNSADNEEAGRGQEEESRSMGGEDVFVIRLSLH